MLDRTRKQLHELFKEEGLKITVDICGGQVDFLDIILDADQKSHRPYKKPNDTPLYINTQSNHPKNIIGNIPDMISKRLRVYLHVDRSTGAHHRLSAHKHHRCAPDRTGSTQLLFTTNGCEHPARCAPVRSIMTIHLYVVGPCLPCF